MNQLPDDSRLRELIQQLKRADQRHAPKFDDVLGRSVPDPVQQPSVRLRLAITVCVAVVLATGLLIVRSQMGDPSQNVIPIAADGGNPEQPDGMSHERRTVDVDFDHLRSTVDKYFSNIEAVESPEWPTSTDSLLVLNLNV